MWYDLTHSYFGMNSQNVQDYFYACLKMISAHLGMRGLYLFKASVSFVKSEKVLHSQILKHLFPVICRAWPVLIKITLEQLLSIKGAKDFPLFHSQDLEFIKKSSYIGEYTKELLYNNGRINLYLIYSSWLPMCVLQCLNYCCLCLLFYFSFLKQAQKQHITITVIFTILL